MIGWDLLDFPARSLYLAITDLLNRRPQFQWMTDRVPQATCVANFGCNQGRETLALFWALGAHEAVGIDKDEYNITAAREGLRQIQQDTQTVLSELQVYAQDHPDDFIAWWSATMPGLFNSGLLNLKTDDVFLRSDITQPTGLVSDHYDLAYCDRVLNHIWVDTGKDSAKAAIREMARVVKPNGVVAASEVIQFPDMPNLDFHPLFKDAGLDLIYTETFSVTSEAIPLFNLPAMPGVVAKYLYRKRGA